MTKILDTLIINLLTFSLVIAASFVVCSKVLIYSIFSLTTVFALGIWFFVYSGAEYVMVLFLIIYLGAVLVFSLFVLMLLDKKYWNLQSNEQSKINLFFNNFIFFGFSMLLIYTSNLSLSKFQFEKPLIIMESLTNTNFQLTNVEEIGLLLYTDFSLLLIIGGIILLVAILGCVTLIKPYSGCKQKDFNKLQENGFEPSTPAFSERCSNH